MFGLGAKNTAWLRSRKPAGKVLFYPICFVLGMAFIVAMLPFRWLRSLVQDPGVTIVLTGIVLALIRYVPSWIDFYKEDGLGPVLYAGALVYGFFWVLFRFFRMISRR
ncbi:hypothetical protein VRRI112168_00195 [Vreelandella rituensis]|uniref:Uncharacterized protein n=1 Tax=Vreelandella rituensis TaxID=2282306 RepID=A0A368UA70_9GAMM|nr:hypothetical protein [Halomonas rituensis]RCV93881.1 hypothetical protein DU506_01610 [Halomonas rituensis]